MPITPLTRGLQSPKSKNGLRQSQPVLLFVSLPYPPPAATVIQGPDNSDTG
jgi:hypothetical protein